MMAVTKAGIQHNADMMEKTLYDGSSSRKCLARPASVSEDIVMDMQCEDMLSEILSYEFAFRGGDEK